MLTKLTRAVVALAAGNADGALGDSRQHLLCGEEGGGKGKAGGPGRSQRGSEQASAREGLASSTFPLRGKAASNEQIVSRHVKPRGGGGCFRT